MAQVLELFLGISADSEVINEQQLGSCIVSNPLTVLVQIFLPVEKYQFVQQIAIDYKLTAAITPTCFHTISAQEDRTC